MMDTAFVKLIGTAIAVVGAATALGLLFKPSWMQSVGRVGNRWITLRRVTRALDKPVDIDSWAVRHGRLVGSLVLLASLYILVRLFFL